MPFLILKENYITKKTLGLKYFAQELYSTELIKKWHKQIDREKDRERDRTRKREIEKKRERVRYVERREWNKDI